MVVSIHDDRGMDFLYFSAVMRAVMIAFVGVRFWSRAVVIDAKSVYRRFWWDDWFCLATLPFAVATFVLLTYRVLIGYGMHVTEQPPANVVQDVKVFVAEWELWLVCVTFPKLSALCFYARVFGCRDKWRFKLALWVTAALSIVWTVICVFLGIFMCTPVEKLWTPQLEGTCRDIATVWIGLGAGELVLDLIILWLPLPLLWNLQLKLWRKVLLVAVFLCGYSVIAATIGRFVASCEMDGSLETDFTYASLTMNYWASAWPTMAIISICLPGIFTLARRGYKHGPRALFTGRDISTFSKPTTTTTTTSRRTWFGSSRSGGRKSASSKTHRSDFSASTSSTDRLYRTTMPYAGQYEATAFARLPSHPASVAEGRGGASSPPPCALPLIEVRKDFDISAASAR